MKGWFAGLGIATGLATAGLLAVAVTGTFNTFSSGALLKSSDLNTNFATLKAAIESIPSQPSMRLIYETDVTSATTSVNVTGLNGNVDMEYEIKCRLISGTAAGQYILINPNGDATSGNYISRGLWANSGTPFGDTNNYGGILISYFSAINQTSQNFSYIYAKTGLTRHLNSVITYVGDAFTLVAGNYSGTWQNSASNITSINIISTQTNGIGAGSHIEVWARR